LKTTAQASEMKAAKFCAIFSRRNAARLPIDCLASRM
jgi:hypothetical protein